MIDNEGSNYEQEIAISIPVTRDYVDLIDNQSRTLEPEIDSENYFDKFLLDIANIKDISALEDNSIYFDSNLDDITMRCINFFQDELDSVFESDLGIRFQNANLFLLRAIYNVFVCKFVNYFIYFINGIQNMDESFVNDIPDYEVYKYKYFKEKMAKKESKYSDISDYIQYVLSLNLSFNDYISIALLEAEGDVDLSAIFIEDANYRIEADFNFLLNKIRKILLSPTISDYVISRVIDQLEPEISESIAF